MIIWFVCSTICIWHKHLFPRFTFKKLSFGLQIVQFTASGNFEEALALCKLLPPEDSSLRSAKESSIHIRWVVLVKSYCRDFFLSILEVKTLFGTGNHLIYY